MTIVEERNNNVLTLKIEGRLDTNTAPTLEITINENLDGVTELILDMNQLTYVSSAGLRVLLSSQKKMNKIGTMKLIGVCEEVMEVFEMTGFVDVLNIES
jgi:anti-sigma B factor antagonist